VRRRGDPRATEDIASRSEAPQRTALSPRTFRARPVEDQRFGQRPIRPLPLFIACLAQVLLVLMLLSSGVVRRPEPLAIEVVSVPHPTEPAQPVSPRMQMPNPVKLTPIVVAPAPVRVADPAERQPQPAAIPIPQPTLSKAATTSITLTPAPPPETTGKVADAFKSAVRAAVFVAYRVPPTAKIMDEYGETRIGFVLTDGKVANVRMLSSSGHASLDRAAMAAVDGAVYPSTPVALRGHQLEFEITLFNRRGG
jgi:TonB family protein